jgi:hypothetical protein
MLKSGLLVKESSSDIKMNDTERDLSYLKDDSNCNIMLDSF